METPKLTVQDLFTVAEGLPDEDMAALTEYVSVFANPKNADGKHVCVNCGASMDGFMAALGVAQAYRWRITHGEAECTGCGWPARGMHYIKRPDGTEVCTLRNVFLPYHPSVVTDAKAEARAS